MSQRAEGEDSICGACTTFAISARAHDLAFLQGLLEASEGLAVIHGSRGGEVFLVTPRSREAETRELLSDVAEERGIVAREVEGIVVFGERTHS